MLTSCASGVSVVNIDNGFGAGFLPSSIVHSNRNSEIYSKPVQGLSERSYTVLTWNSDGCCIGCVDRFVQMPLRKQ